MKNLIMIALVLCLILMSGCNDDEMIEISDRTAENQQDIVESSTAFAEDEEPVAREGNNSGSSENSNKETGDLDDSQSLVVFVCGEVKNPGVYKLSEGSRVIDAVMNAGGYTSEACDTYLNLAAGLADSQMIYVPSNKELSDEESGDKILNEANLDLTVKNSNLYGINGNAISTDTNSGQGGVVNINLASKEELMSLPGIGESKAEKIIAYRESNGKFKSTEEIMQISGIKEGLYNKVKDKICVR